MAFILFNCVVFIWKTPIPVSALNSYCQQRWLCNSSEWDWGESMDAVSKSNMDYSESSVGFCPCWQAFLIETVSLAAVKKDDFEGSQVQNFKFLPNSLRFVIFTRIPLSIKGFFFICSQLFFFIYFLLAEKLCSFA